jgi:hypothetical protein
MSITEKEVTVKETETNSWFNQYDNKQEAKDLLPIFKMDLAPGQLSRKEEVTFLSNGVKKTTKFGEAIIFNIVNQGKDYVWFIKENQYNLLNPIAAEAKLNKLEGRTAVVERIGLKKETRWAITFK